MSSRNKLKKRESTCRERKGQKRREKLDASTRQKKWEAPINKHNHTHTQPNPCPKLPLLAIITIHQWPKTGLCQRRACAAAHSKVLTDNYRLWLPWQYVAFFQAMLLSTKFNAVNKAKERPNNRPLAIAPAPHSSFPKNDAFSLNDFKRPSYKNIIECSVCFRPTDSGVRGLLAGAEACSNSFSCYCAAFF